MKFVSGSMVRIQYPENHLLIFTMMFVYDNK